MINGLHVAPRVSGKLSNLITIPPCVENLKRFLRAMKSCHKVKQAYLAPVEIGHLHGSS